MEAKAAASHPRVLLVDDDESILDSMALYFSSQLLVFHTARSAELALDLLDRQSYDVVIMDYRLPGMNGLELLARLRTRFPRSRLVLTTAHGTPEILVQARTSGAERTIEKPLTVDKVMGVLGRAQRPVACG